MKPETFFEKFDQFADAPDAVTKMRELVLELAIQGRLAAQNSDDKPALNQLERIAAKKAKVGRVVRAKSGRAATSAVEETETHVPHGWAKSCLAELVTVLNGRAYSKDELLAAGTPVLRVGNLFTSNHWYYSDLELGPAKYCDTGDLIFAWSASFGPFIWPGPKAIYHYHIWKLELHSEADLNKGYLYWFLQNKTQEIKRAGHGVSMLHMTKGKMEKLEVMVPPLAEQRRIVAKVDELMALCDRLEAQQQERETRHAALIRASLARFAEAPTPANLPFLFHPSYPIPPADLRKSILTLAVQGKLVPQDPNDEPSVKLLARVAAALPDKKSENPFLREIESSITDESEYELPPGWTWLPLGHVGVWATGCGFPTQYQGETDKEFLFCKVSDMNLPGNEVEIHTTVHSIDTDVMKKIRARANPVGTVIFPKIGGAIATHKRRLVIKPTIIDNNCSGIRPIGLTDDRWLLLFMRNLDLTRYQSGTSVPAVSQGALDPIRIGLPPLAEQKRIVAKVDQLIALVDELETQLAASCATAANLLSALVAELMTVIKPEVE
tara:strand:+ start:3622 stop:5280 length:1659 start_codon:yes stop_codon:yes gene_type:complete